MPTATRQRLRVWLVQPFPERQGRRRPDQEARRVGVDQVGLAIEPGHQQERAGHDQPHPRPIAPRQEMKADRDRQGKLDNRRHSPRRDVFHPMTEKGVGRQVQLACQRGVKIDAVPSIRPVVEQVERVERLLDVTPGMDLAHLLPPLDREHLAVTVRRFIPGQPEIADRRHQCRQGDAAVRPRLPDPTAAQAAAVLLHGRRVPRPDRARYGLVCPPRAGLDSPIGTVSVSRMRVDPGRSYLAGTRMLGLAFSAARTALRYFGWTCSTVGLSVPIGYPGKRAICFTCSLA